jgi:hypothetical protein
VLEKFRTIRRTYLEHLLGRDLDAGHARHDAVEDVLLSVVRGRRGLGVCVRGGNHA